MSDPTPLKTCFQCGQEKPATPAFFIRDKNRLDGWRNPCRMCRKEQIRQPRQPAHTPSVGGVKQCNVCREIKNTSEFYCKNGGRPIAQCKQCSLKRDKEKYDAKHGVLPLPPNGFKRCATCKEVKPATTEFFHHHFHTSDSLRSECKACRSADRQINKEKYIRAYQNRSEERKERQRQTRRVYRQRNKERLGPYEKQYGKEYYERHKQKKLQYYQDHREYYRAYHRAYQKTHAEKLRAYNQSPPRRYALRTRFHLRRAIKKATSGAYAAQDIQRQFKAQKGKCYYCTKKLGSGKGERHIDHVVPLSKGGTNMPDNIVITCPTCNLKKGNKLPHEFPEGNRLL